MAVVEIRRGEEAEKHVGVSGVKVLTATLVAVVTEWSEDRLVIDLSTRDSDLGLLYDVVRDGDDLRVIVCTALEPAEVPA